jgi:hypothetical protein
LRPGGNAILGQGARSAGVLCAFVVRVRLGASGPYARQPSRYSASPAGPYGPRSAGAVDPSSGTCGRRRARQPVHRKPPGPAPAARLARRTDNPPPARTSDESSPPAGPTPDPRATSKEPSPGALATRPARPLIRGAKPSPDPACWPREQQAQKGRCRGFGRPKSAPPDVTRGDRRMEHQRLGCRVAPASLPERFPASNTIGSGLGR